MGVSSKDTDLGFLIYIKKGIKENVSVLKPVMSHALGSI